jgi:outer membrane protein TolC
VLKVIRSLILVVIMSVSSRAIAQEGTRVFALQDLYGIIINTHPVVRQAYLLNDVARQELRIARGAFDPTVSSYYSRKEFGGTTYYDAWDSQLRIPTWFGVDFRAGFEQTGGTYLNPERRTPPDQGMAYAGLTIPLGQGLLIDSRRATVRQAQLFQEMAEADRIRMINNIIIAAARDYWDWFYAHQQYQYLAEGQRLADIRFRAVRQRVVFGDLAPIDSVEARIILQDRTVQLQQAGLNFRNAAIRLSNYLWADDMTPRELSEELIPDTNFRLFTNLNPATLEEMFQMARENHPDLVRLEFRLRQLDIEEQLRIEMLKPKVDLNYQFLNRGFRLDGDQYDPFRNGNFLANNYRVGLSVAFPIFLRRERGQLQLTRARIRTTQLDRTQRDREILNSIQITYNDLLNMEELLSTQASMVENYNTLLRSELMRFNAGESSLFLINARETRLIEEQIKLANLQTRYLKAKATLIWAAGRNEWPDN